VACGVLKRVVMDGVNKVIVLGNLGADPELRMNPGGNAVLKLRVATNESWVDKEQKKHERVEWHRVTVFGRRAEGLAKFVRKGMKVFVEGRNQTSTYDKDGQKHYSTEIIAEQVLVTGTPRSTDSRTDGAAEGEDAPFAPHASTTNGAFRRAPAAPAATDIPF
jgi:single-strand DNA-binding protein